MRVHFIINSGYTITTTQRNERTGRNNKKKVHTHTLDKLIKGNIGCDYIWCRCTTEIIFKTQSIIPHDGGKKIYMRNNP